MQRRHLLTGAAASFAGLAPAASVKGRALALDLKNAADQLFAYVKMTGDLEDGKEVIGWMKGTVYSVFDDGANVEPLFAAGALSFSRSFKDTETSYKNTSNFIICYMDLRSGAVLEEWYNPWLKRTVPVVNYASRIDTITRANTAVSEKTAVRIEWMQDGDDVIRWTDGRMKKKNPITPDKWPKASVGEWYFKNQSSQIIAKLSDLTNPDLTAVDSLTMGQRFGPWYPWMEMGQAAGRTYRRDVSKRAKQLDDVPGPIPVYAARRFPEFMQAPQKWEGIYVDPETLWTQQQPPEVA